MSSLHLDQVTFDKLIDPWMDSCSPACHTLNLSTWKDLESQSEDGRFSCPFSRAVLTIDSLRKNTLAADLIAQRDGDKEIKKIINSSDPLSGLIKKLDKMNQNMLDRDAKMEAKAAANQVELHAKIDILSKVVVVSHQQVMNLSNISWSESLAIVACPCSRATILKKVKNKGIKKADRQLIEKFKEDLDKAEKDKQSRSSVSASSSSSPSQEK